VGERLRTPARPLRDPKTVLQEWAQARGLPTPSYREIARTGPHHDPEFRVAVELPEFVPAEGMGRSKRAAEQAAAAAMLTREGVEVEAAADMSETGNDPKDAGQDTGRDIASQRCGFVAVIGLPMSASRPSSMRRSGSKVTIAAPRCRPRGRPIRGIAIERDAQLIFVDTPGIFAPRRRLDPRHGGDRVERAHDADIVALLVDAKRGLDDETSAIIAKLADVAATTMLVINKVDLVAKPSLLGLVQAANERMKFVATFMVSAQSGDGVGEVKRWLAGNVPAGPWHYPEDQISDAPMRALAAEITREKIYHRLHRSCRIAPPSRPMCGRSCATARCASSRPIFVERESQRKIALGKGGQAIRSIGSDARKEIARLIEKPVHLFLFVKVREGWADDPERYREMGLEFPRD